MRHTLEIVGTTNEANNGQTIKPSEPDKPVITSEDLEQFQGTEQYYKHFLNQFVYTDGVQYLAQEAKAYWLLDAIASHQIDLLRKDPTLKDFQFWKLKVNTKDKTATLVCERDTNQVVVSQAIGYTTFPLAEVKLYLIEKVLLLPSEY
jgi:hypothetical protein